MEHKNFAVCEFSQVFTYNPKSSVIDNDDLALNSIRLYRNMLLQKKK